MSKNEDDAKIIGIGAADIEGDSGENNERERIKTKGKSRKNESDRREIDTENGVLDQRGGIFGGLWHRLNAEYPWVKVAVLIAVVLMCFGFLRARSVPEQQIATVQRGIYSELHLKPPVKKKRELQRGKLIALTFDDGPSVATTPRLLDILKEKQVPVTFFVLGTMAERNPEIIKRELQEGHEVASHTTWHQNLSKLNLEQIRGDMAESCRILTQVTGVCTNLVRPPYGAINENVKVGLGRPLIIWSVDTEDWRSRDAQKIKESVKKASFDGAVVLFHDIYASTVDAIPDIIDNLRKEGYEFVTISEFAEARGVSLESGGVYGVFRP